MNNNILDDFDEMSSTERHAFIAWFHGGMNHVTKYAERKHVFFGKAECE